MSEKWNEVVVFLLSKKHETILTNDNVGRWNRKMRLGRQFSP